MRAWLNFKTFLVFLLLWATRSFGAQQDTESTINMPIGVTPISKQIYHLHMTIFWICVGIGIAVFSVLIFSLIKHRKSKGAVPAKFHGHTLVEIIWAVVPLLILVAMAIPATKVLMQMDDDSQAEVNIKITGYQWKWKYEYLDEGISFFSNLSTPYDQLQNKASKGVNYLREVDNPMVVPIHKKIRFLITSNDVIHSWWVPALGVKRDAIPGFIYEAWARIDKPGIYRGQCAELCGLNHGYMPIVVDARSEADYKQWAEQHRQANTQAIDKPVTLPTLTKEELLHKGENAYNTVCAACHKSDGNGMPPAFPALRGSKITTGPVADHIAIVLNGKPGTAMQAFSSQLSDTDIAAIVTYERNAWGNADTQKYGKNAGGIVQPSTVQQQRQGNKPAAKNSAAQPVIGESAAAALNLANKTKTLTSNKPLTKDELLQKGEEVYNTTCAACHKPDGSGMPPTYPALKGSRIATGPVAEHIAIVLHGKPSTLMPAFGGLLTDSDIAAVITYERNSWGNAAPQNGKTAGGLVQANDVAKQRDKK